MPRESWASVARSLSGEDEIDELRGELVSFAQYVMDYCNDPRVVREAERVLQRASFDVTEGRTSGSGKTEGRAGNPQGSAAHGSVGCPSAPPSATSSTADEDKP